MEKIQGDRRAPGGREESREAEEDDNGIKEENSKRSERKIQIGSEEIGENNRTRL